MKKLLMVISLVVLFCFTFGCKKQEQVERFMEEGVEVVINHLEPYKIKGESSDLFIEEEFRIDTEREEFLKIGFVEISAFDVDSEGNIYFLNPRSNANLIFKFDKNGEFLTSFGRKGQGPGEIQASMHLDINHEGQILIPDQGKRELLFLKENGEFIESKSADLFFMKIHPLPNGNYLVWHQDIGAPRDEYLAQTPLSLFSSDFEEIMELDRYKLQNYRVTGKRKGTEPLFSWSVSDKHIYIGNEDRDYEIWVFDFSGNLVRKIRKEYKRVHIPDEFQRERVETLSENLKSVTYFPESFPPFQGFFADDLGKLYVMTYEQEEGSGEYIFDIFNKEGAFIGRKSLKAIYGLGYVMAMIKQKHLYCIKEKESGYKELMVYKMRWE